MSIFEIIMLVCFGAAWPFSLRKSYVSRRNEGKSLAFLVVVCVGYAAGVAHKVLRHPDAVTALYALNGIMVFIDIMLYLRNKKIARRNGRDINTPRPTEAK
ncbi:MAG: hypothetical protein QME32_06565 [Endomicrobiia bacterium]|nr:hypothetical protein [Endomicrobiia bacterium]